MRSLLSSASRLARGAAIALSLGVFADGCSLGNLAHDDCTTDAQCAAAFGGGSKCSAGYCSAAVACTTGHDCRAQAGGGACVNGTCTLKLPSDPACDAIMEPPDLLSQPATGPDAPLVIGGLYSLALSHDLNL